jgi:hypothetical protein
MTEAEWLVCTEPVLMLRALRGMATQRKLRLLICACCRRLWPLLREDAMRNAVEVGDAHAGDEDFNDQADHYDAAAAPLLKEISPEMSRGTIFVEGYARQCLIQAVLSPLTPIWGVTLTGAGTADALTWAAEGVGRHAAEQPPRLVERWAEARHQDALAREKKEQSDLVREVFGPLLFRPIPLKPEWRTASAVSIATPIYADRAFDRMSDLANTLQDARCDSAEILAHCRGPGPHVRGCWVVDAVLNKE